MAWEYILTFQRHWFPRSCPLQHGLSVPTCDHSWLWLCWVKDLSWVWVGNCLWISSLPACPVMCKKGYCPCFSYWEQAIFPVATWGSVMTRTEISPRFQINSLHTQLPSVRLTLKDLAKMNLKMNRDTQPHIQLKYSWPARPKRETKEGWKPK